MGDNHLDDGLKGGLEGKISQRVWRRKILYCPSRYDQMPETIVLVRREYIVFRVRLNSYKDIFIWGLIIFKYFFPFNNYFFHLIIFFRFIIINHVKIHWRKIKKKEKKMIFLEWDNRVIYKNVSPGKVQF